MDIYVECNTDHYIINRLLEKKNQKKHCSLHHLGGKFKIINKLSESDSCIGIVDEDPGKTDHPDMKYYIKVKEISYFDMFRSKNNTLIRMKPDLESIIIDAINKSKIRPNEYKIPTFEKEYLHMANPYKNNSYKRLLDYLIDEKNVFDGIYSLILK